MELGNLPGNRPAGAGEDVIPERPLEGDGPMLSHGVEDESYGVKEQHAVTVTNIWDKKRRVAKPLLSGKLTKRFLVGLREGLYVVSNRGRSPARPCFEGYTAPPEKREKQWQSIRATGADNNLCRVFGSRRDYDAYMGPLLLAYIRKFQRD